jgi:hypothetical protein
VLFYVFLCCSTHCFLSFSCTVCAYMCSELLAPGGYPIAVKYITSYHKRVVISVCNGTPTQVLSVPQNMRDQVSLNTASATGSYQKTEPPSKIEQRTLYRNLARKYYAKLFLNKISHSRIPFAAFPTFRSD